MTLTTRWVSARLGIKFVADDGITGDLGLGLAVRRNPRRAHLFVNPALAKHVPVPPNLPRDVASRLAESVLKEFTVTSDVLVIGFAETATGLGQMLAERLAPVDFITTTRDFEGPLSDGHVAFEEEHSHAVSHRLTPRSPRFLTGRRLIILVDDELTTGRTALNTAAQLAPASLGAAFVIATLVDARDEDDRTRVASEAARLGIDIRVVSLASVALELPAGILDAAAEIGSASPAPRTSEGGAVHSVEFPVPVSAHIARLGIEVLVDADDSMVNEIASRILATIWPSAGDTVHVLGEEEQVYLPVRLAEVLAAEWRMRGVKVVVSSTTRSPIVVVDDPGYPIRTDTPYWVGGNEQRHAYNIEHDTRFVVVVPESRVDAADRLNDLVEAVASCCEVVRVIWR